MADRVLHDLRTVVDATAATFHRRALPIKERELGRQFDLKETHRL